MGETDAGVDCSVISISLMLDPDWIGDVGTSLKVEKLLLVSITFEGVEKDRSSKSSSITPAPLHTLLKSSSLSSVYPYTFN